MSSRISERHEFPDASRSVIPKRDASFGGFVHDAAVTELDEIATFVRVVEAGGFSAAADSLGVPKSTVSRRVARLEERLGVRLLHRTTRRMRPTPEGVAFYEKVAPAIGTLKEATVEVLEGRDHPRGHLRISAPVDFGTAYLSEIVTTFLKTYDDVSVEFVLTGDYVDLVADGIDGAIRGGKLADTSLVARRLGMTAFWLVASPAYLNEHKRPKKPADLERHACIVHRPTVPKDTWTLIGPKKTSSTVRVHAKLHSDSFSFNRSAAIAGAGITRLPAFLAAEEIGAGRLERVLPSHHFGGSPLQFIYPSARQLPAKTAAFRDHLVEFFSRPERSEVFR